MTIRFVKNVHISTSGGTRAPEDNVAVKVGGDFFVPQLFLAQ
jgi:hypothetical protein